MYIPKQVPYLLDKNFKENIEYTEYYIEDLQKYAMCIWCMKSKMVIKDTIYNYILPDACIDIVIDFSNHSICFAGFSRETVPFLLNQTVDFMGVRLKPGAFYLLYGIEAFQVMDHSIDFFQLEKNTNLEDIFTLQQLEERLLFFQKYLQTKIQKQRDRSQIVMVDLLYQSPRDKSVVEIAEGFGYTKRHLTRLFKKYYGISPKVLLNILRLHLCLTLLLEGGQSIDEIMEICGFYDQSHFIKEIKKYTGFSPLELLETIQK